MKKINIINSKHLCKNVKNILYPVTNSLNLKEFSNQNKVFPKDQDMSLEEIAKKHLNREQKNYSDEMKDTNDVQKLNNSSMKEAIFRNDPKTKGQTAQGNESYTTKIPGEPQNTAGGGASSPSGGR